MLTTSYFIIRFKMSLTLVLAAVSVLVCAASAARAQGVPPLPGPGCATQPSGAVAWYPGNGTAEDVQGGNHGTLRGSATFTQGKVGQAFLFDGGDGDIRVPASDALNVGAGDGLTVELWINPSDRDPWRPLVEWNNGGGDGDGVHFWINVLFGGENGGRGRGALYANLIDTSGGSHYIGTDADTLVSNTFQHVALTYDKGTGVARIFRNGVEVKSVSFTPFTPQTSHNLYLGSRLNSKFAGLMDEVGIYNRALSGGEIRAIHRASSLGKCASTVGGRITDECGTPLNKVVINAERLGGGAPRSARTDDDGRYSFNTVPAGGSYTFTPQPIETPGRFVPPSVTFVNLKRDETADFYHRPLMPTTCQAPIVYLSDLRMAADEVYTHIPARLDRSVTDGTITLNGVAYDKGLGAHSTSEIVYSLGGNYSSFVSDVGVDDRTGPAGSAVFRVFADGELLYESGVMTGGSLTQSINISVAGKQELRLVVTDANDGFLWDHADWAAARLVR